jgi:hypothetical protein
MSVGEQTREGRIITYMRRRVESRSFDAVKIPNWEELEGGADVDEQESKR